MRVVLFLTMFFSLVFACGGSCLDCHPKLQPFIDDQDHRILKECTTCHNQPAQHGGACGQDCFDCHQKEKLYSDTEVKEHQAIKACYECHKDNTILKAPESKSSTSGLNEKSLAIDVFK